MTPVAFPTGAGYNARLAEEMAGRRVNVPGRDHHEWSVMMGRLYGTPSNPSTRGASESAAERAELALSRRLTLAFASYGTPRVPTADEAERRANELEAVARLARQAVRR